MTGTSDSLFDQFYKVSTVNQGHNVFISLGKYIISVQRVWVNKERHWALENCLQFFLHLINDNIFWVRVFLSSRKERIFCSSVTLKSSSAHLPLHKNSLPILVHESWGLFICTGSYLDHQLTIWRHLVIHSLCDCNDA